MTLCTFTKLPNLFVLLVVLLTIILFPTKEHAAIINMSTGELVASVDRVSLAPAFNIADRNPKNSIQVSPNLDEYAKSTSSQESLALILVDRSRNEFGEKSTEWSFASGIWMLLIALPSIVVAGAMSWILKKCP